jgi:hypothetical protein
MKGADGRLVYLDFGQVGTLDRKVGSRWLAGISGQEGRFKMVGWCIWTSGKFARWTGR